MHELVRIADRLSRRLQALSFGLPVTHVYNPLVYARRPFAAYAERHAHGAGAVLLLGMNPGPFGMAQTGVPFGEISVVRDWLGVEAEVGHPPHEHPRRPVQGFACQRSEVSGARLWGWARRRFVTPERFFAKFFVANYCPLVFMESSGRNRTPDKLPPSEREPLFAACDEALRATIAFLRPSFVVGVGAFAESRAQSVAGDAGVVVGRIPHPSPASPLANAGWAEAAEGALRRLGVTL